jgi:membrane fusion protein (multidrug efflux system)
MISNRFSRFLFLTVLAVFFVLTAACGGGQREGEQTANQTNENQGKSVADGSAKDSEGAETQQPAGVPVRTITVSRGDISTGVLATSVIEAEQKVDIYSRVTGTVTELNAEEGNSIGKGKPLCKLEDEELRLAESKAQSVMEKAERDLERTRLQVEKKVLAENDLINAQYIYAQAKLDWEQKKTSLEYTNIASTIDGIVSERLVRLGQKVDPSIKLYSLFDPKSLVVSIHIPESDYFRLVSEKGTSTTAVVTTESLPGMEFRGKIKRIAPVVDPATNTIKITITYDDPQRILRPGMYVRVKLITDTHSNTVLIPKNAILYDENMMYVFVVRGDQARKITLETGYSDTEFVESLSGIEAGEKVVVVGQTGLKEGTKVRLVNEEGSGGSGQMSTANAR